MRVLATGGSGHFAGLVVPALVRAGVEVRALVHDPDRADVPRRQGAAEVVLGDLADPASLEEAVRDIDAAFLITPAFAPDATRMGLNLIDAAAAAGATKIVYSGVYHPSLSLINHASTRPIEEALYRADLQYVVLQPAMFMQGLIGPWRQALREGTVVMPWSKHSAMTYVDYRDVADAVAIAVTSDRLDNGTFELAAPGMLSRIDLAAILSEVAGRHVVAQDPDPNLPSGGEQDGLREMVNDYDAHGFHGGNALVLRSILQREPRTLRAFLQELSTSSST